MRCSISNRARLKSRGKYHPPAMLATLIAPYLLMAPAAKAGNTEVVWELGASNQYFHYEETLPSGETFNTEKGWIPGLYLSASTQLPKDFQLTATASRAKGAIDYKGQTQTGLALSTDTIETLTRMSIELATPLPKALPASLSGIINVGYTRWNRKIQATSFTSHLYEHYRWYEFSGGLRHCSTIPALPVLDRICLTTKLTRTEYGDVTVRLEKFGLGKPELNLGGHWGGEASMKLILEKLITLRLYTKVWNHGASKPVFAQRANEVVRITEPASQSWLTGFEVGFRF